MSLRETVIGAVVVVAAISATLYVRPEILEWILGVTLFRSQTISSTTNYPTSAPPPSESSSAEPEATARASPKMAPNYPPQPAPGAPPPMTPTSQPPSSPGVETMVPAPAARNGGEPPAAKNGGGPPAAANGHGAPAMANGGSRVLLSVYAFFKEPSREPGDYALYSYALVPFQNDRARVFFSALFGHTGARAASALPNRALNVILLPVMDAFQETTVAVDGADAFADGGYAYDRARDMLALLCAERHEKLARFCAGEATRGPYVVSFRVPASGALARAEPAPQPFLFVDFTDLDPGAFAEVLDTYKSQVRRDAFDDSDPVESMRVRLLSIVLTAAHWINPVRSALGEILEVVGGS